MPETFGGNGIGHWMPPFENASIITFTVSDSERFLTGGNGVRDGYNGGIFNFERLVTGGYQLHKVRRHVSPAAPLATPTQE